MTSRPPPRPSMRQREMVTLDPESVHEEANPAAPPLGSLEPQLHMPQQGVRHSKVGFALAGVGLLAALGLGAYSWHLSMQFRATQAEVESAMNRAQQHIVAVTAERDEARKQSKQALAQTEEAKQELAKSNAKLQEASAAVEEQLSEFREVREKFRRMIDAGTLDINFRRGRMIVELPAAVLFDSGSAELSEEGQKAVTEVAKILKSVPRHRFLVGGHTDNVPAVKEYKSNWDLSAARAVRVTESLTRHGVNPSHLVIAGYAQFDPVASNATGAGRQKNRRIEIILEPRVEQKMLESLTGSDGTESDGAESGSEAQQAKGSKAP